MAEAVSGGTPPPGQYPTVGLQKAALAAVTWCIAPPSASDLGPLYPAGQLEMSG